MFRARCSRMDMADALSISTGHLSRMFHQETGRKLVDYLQEVRMEHAVRLLSEGKLSNEEICEDYPDWAPRLKMLTWDLVRKELSAVAAKVRNEVRVIHSPTDDTLELNTTRLDYNKYENRPNDFENGLYV